MALLSYRGGLAQTPATPTRIGAIEAKARAILAEDSVRFEFPLSIPAIPGLHASAWLLSPKGKRSGETVADLRQGSTAVSIQLPRPKDEHGKFIEDLSWYRIAYRVQADTGQQSEGIVAIGAIAPNLMELRLARPAWFTTGKPIGIRLYAGNPVTRKPFRGVHLEAKLEIASEASSAGDSPKQTLVREAITDGTGEAQISFPGLDRVTGPPTLTVYGTLKSANGGYAEASIVSELNSWDQGQIHIETDKPLHKPGETVHLRALVFAGAKAVANAAYTLTIKDPDNKELLEVPLTTNRFGIAVYDWKTREQLAPGDYEVRVGNSDDAEYSTHRTMRISIRRYQLPEFAVTATMDRGSYLAGQAPVVRIHAGYLFGKPVATGTVSIAHARDEEWNPKTQRYEKTREVGQSAALDANGDAEMHLDVKTDFDDFKDSANDRYRDVEFRAIVTDLSSGRSEPRKFTVRLTHDPIHIYLNELEGNQREGEFIVNTSYADGGPIACKVTLDWLDDGKILSRAANVTTNRYGLAKVHLQYPPRKDTGYHEYELRLLAHDAEGRISKYDDRVYTRPEGIVWFTVAHTLLKPNQPIDAIVHGPHGATLDLDVYSAGGLLAHRQLHMGHEIEPFDVPANAAFHGLITLVACQMNIDAPEYSELTQCSTRSVLYPEDRKLRVKLAGLQPSYLPGADVQAGLNLSGTAGVLGVSVFDTGVEQRAATEDAENDRWSRGKWWLDDESISGLTEDDLNRIDMSQPVSDDLDLVAEAIVHGKSVEAFTVESNRDDSERNLYESSIDESLKPVGAAVLAARPTRLPATLESLQSITRAAKMGESLLKDPWNTPYKVETSARGTNDVLRLVSAGPDKRFGTGDDFDVVVATRNQFALPGERLTKLLEEAVAAGQTLPATVEGLKQLAQTGGLDLDATLDRDGKPYRYEIRAWRRFYSVQVYPHLSEPLAAIQSSSWEIWSTPAIDYFSRTEASLNAAMRAWLAAGNGFPETEEEARRVFTTAGIDFDALRDPLGRPFKLRVTQVMGYTHVEKVKAGGDLEVKGKPVSHLMRAVQVQHPSELSGEMDVVAQFLHPVAEQSGSDLRPHAMEDGVFSGDTGAIGGTVTDQTGAIVAGASVALKNGGGVPVDSARTAADGTYLFRDLPTGPYTLSVQAKGFESSVVHEILVSSAQLTTVDVELPIGAEMQTVTVEADALAVQTESASVSSVAKQIGQTGRAAITSPTFTPRLRHVFEETAYWAPSLETNATGHATLHFRLPDSLTTWKLHALASTTNGRIGVLDQTFKTFQPFFVDLDAPQVLTLGDEITLPVNLRNYTARSLALPVTVKPADWFSLLTPAKVEATVPSSGTMPVLFGFRATRTAEAGPLHITAANAHDGDAIEKTVRVHPDGEPRAVTVSGLLRGSATTLGLDLPADAIPGSVHAELRLYPNLGAHILHSMKAVLERPYGCGEQTISSTYPSLLFLKLLKAAKSTSPDEDEAQTYLQLGYDRLTGYFAANGGLTYWGNPTETPDAALTAYGVEFLTDAEPYIAVDEAHIVDAVGWLVSSQQPDGSWKPHYGDTNAELNLYIAEVLKHTLPRDAPKELRERVNLAVSRATEWAATSVAAVHDPYANALRLRMYAEDATSAKLRAELAQSATHDREGAHWASASSSPFYGWGHAGNLETTALVLNALERSGTKAGDRSLLDDALFYLLRNQDRYGVWYSGQATVRVLQALLPRAIDQMTATAGAAEFSLAVNGAPLTQKDADALHADPKLLEAPRSLDLTSLLKAGHNELVFSNTSEAALASAEAAVNYYAPWQQNQAPAQFSTQTGKEYGLDFGYKCDATNSKVGQPVSCTVDVRRFGSSGYGMLLAEVGLPPGSEVDRASLAKLLDNSTISRYELQPDRIVFYLWSWRAEGSHFGFSFTPRYAIHAKAAPATLSDYYNPDLKVVLTPQSFTVTDPVRK